MGNFYCNDFGFPYYKDIKKIKNDLENVIQNGAGKSAYQVAVENGFAGTEAEWIASLKGESGTASTSIDDNVTNGSQTWTSSKIRTEIDTVATKTSEIIKTPKENYFDKTKVTSGGYYSYSTGNWTVSAGNSSTDFILVSANEAFSKPATASQITYWDSNKQFISGVSTSSANFVVPNNSNIKYMRLSLLDTSLDTFMVVKGYVYPSTYVSYSEVYNFSDTYKFPSDDTVDFVDSLGKTRTNLLNLEAVIPGYYNATTGVLTQSAGYYSTDYIPVEKNQIFSKSTKGSNSSVTFWDTNKAFISGVSAAGTVTVPNNDSIKYMIVTLYAYSDLPIDTQMIVEGSTLPQTYIPYSYQRLSSEVDFENYKVEMQTTLDRLFCSPNTSNYIDVTISGLYTQMTHPSLLYFSSGWNGHKYWMACTPYPLADDKKENPSIIVSDDGIDWFEPSGISNPIAPCSDTSTYYNSDCELVYNDTLARIECWYRKCTRISHEETILRRTSTDGITWSAEESLFTVSLGSIGALSPSVIYDSTNSKYQIWVNHYGVGLKYYETADGTNWNYIRTINVDSTLWHMSVKKLGTSYEIYYSNGLPGNQANNFYISYVSSSDNITYSTPIKVITAQPGRIDSMLYRPTFANITDAGYIAGTKRLLIYGITDDFNHWRLGMSVINTRSPQLARGFLF